MRSAQFHLLPFSPVVQGFLVCLLFIYLCLITLQTNCWSNSEHSMSWYQFLTNEVVLSRWTKKENKKAHDNKYVTSSRVNLKVGEKNLTLACIHNRPCPGRACMLKLLVQYRVRSFSFPGSTPVCDVFFPQNERVQIITHVHPGKKPPPHTGG